MNFLDIIAVFLLILILLVIVNNIFMYGRDLAKYPRRLDDYYPGSLADDYETDYDSSSDDDDDDDEDKKHHKPHHKSHHHAPPKHKSLNHKHIASYVSDHLPSNQ